MSLTGLAIETPRNENKTLSGLFWRCRRGWRFRWCRWSGRRIRVPGIANVLPLSILLARDREKLAGFAHSPLHSPLVRTRFPTQIARDTDVGLRIEHKYRPGRLRVSDVLGEKLQDCRAAAYARRARRTQQCFIGVMRGHTFPFAAVVCLLPACGLCPDSGFIRARWSGCMDKTCHRHHQRNDSDREPRHV